MSDLLNREQIHLRCATQDMISPFCTGQVTNDQKTGLPVISYGMEEFGYSVRMGPNLKVLSIGGSPLDPKSFSPARLADYKPRGWVIPAGLFFLAETVEYFKIPTDVTAMVTGKSTYERLGLTVDVGWLKPGWEGRLVLEIKNDNEFPVRIYPGEGIAFLAFYQGETSGIPYQGVYQDQKGITGPKAYSEI